MSTPATSLAANDAFDPSQVVSLPAEAGISSQLSTLHGIFVKMNAQRRHVFDLFDFPADGSGDWLQHVVSYVLDRNDRQIRDHQNRIRDLSVWARSSSLPNDVLTEYAERIRASRQLRDDIKHLRYSLSQRRGALSVAQQDAIQDRLAEASLYGVATGSSRGHGLLQERFEQALDTLMAYTDERTIRRQFAKLIDALEDIAKSCREVDEKVTPSLSSTSGPTACVPGKNVAYLIDVMMTQALLQSEVELNAALEPPIAFQAPTHHAGISELLSLVSRCHSLQTRLERIRALHVDLEERVGDIAQEVFA
ncbi:hypothetical protein C8Q73DRAFT_840383 [Cubamyces lactineus]|nr:hypothetical protein C8Q73DRAFT_840383 [Cubamyces lactineus]